MFALFGIGDLVGNGGSDANEVERALEVDLVQDWAPLNAIQKVEDGSGMR